MVEDPKSIYCTFRLKTDIFYMVYIILKYFFQLKQSSETVLARLYYPKYRLQSQNPFFSFLKIAQ